MTSSNGYIFRVTGPLWWKFTGEFPSKGQWRGALMFSLICVWTSGWVNNRGAGDLRRHRDHCDVTVMEAMIIIKTQGGTNQNSTTNKLRLVQHFDFQLQIYKDYGENRQTWHKLAYLIWRVQMSWHQASVRSPATVILTCMQLLPRLGSQNLYSARVVTVKRWSLTGY